MKLKSLTLKYISILIVIIILSHTGSDNMKHHLMAAHRGYSAVYPENTILAFDKAIEEGCNAIELDIQRSKDGIIVVLHDITVDRTTDGTGNVYDLTWSELSQLDAGSWKGQQFAGVRIPKFEEVLDRYNGTGIFILVEIKDPSLYLGIEKQLADMIRSKRMEQQVIVMSFDWDFIDKIKDYYPLIQTGLVGNGGSSISDAINRCINKKHEFVTWHFASLTQSDIEALNNANIISGAWIVNEEQDIQTAINMGIKVITGDYADRLSSIAEQKNIVQDIAYYRTNRKASPKVCYDGIWDKVYIKVFDGQEWRLSEPYI